MAGLIKTTLKRNPWGDDHPEKLSDNSANLNAKAQLKGLFDPDAWFRQLLGGSTSTEKPTKTFFEKNKFTQRETVIFSARSEREQENLNKETQIILAKLKEQVVLLEKSEKNLSAEISKVKVEQLPRKSSIYYIRFLEWLLTLVKQLRIKVEQGRAWLATFNQRKKKRLGYWQMYKKHGTTFGLSHERSLATQTG